MWGRKGFAQSSSINYSILLCVSLYAQGNPNFFKLMNLNLNFHILPSFSLVLLLGRLLGSSGYNCKNSGIIETHY